MKKQVTIDDMLCLNTVCLKCDLIKKAEVISI